MTPSDCGNEFGLMCERARAPREDKEMKDLRTKTELKLNLDKMSWANARQVCRSWGGDLAAMEDAAMHGAVAELLAGGEGGWTGAIRDGADW